MNSSLRCSVWDGHHFEIVDSSLSALSRTSASAIFSHATLIVVAFRLALRSMAHRAQADVFVSLDACSIIFISSWVNRMRKVAVRFSSSGFGGRPAISQEIVQQVQTKSKTYCATNCLDSVGFVWHNNNIMNKLSKEKRAAPVRALVEGVGVNSTVRMTGVSKPTILNLLRDLGEGCAAYHDKHVRGLKLERVQTDEIWSFNYCKQKNVPKTKTAPPEAGDAWLWTGLDSDSKLIIAYRVGQRTQWDVDEFMLDLARSYPRSALSVLR